MVSRGEGARVGGELLVLRVCKQNPAQGSILGGVGETGSILNIITAASS